MNNKVLHTICSHNLLSEGDRVIVALSGGADSVVLFNLLLDLKEKLDLKIYAAHLNHNLRGEESLRDENFVKKLCGEKNVELFLKSVDVNALCIKSGQGFEAVGRQVRYDFFEELSLKYDAFVATAHTLSDSAETALLNMARGSSLSGLCSIPYKRQRIIRPLLDVTREEVENYAFENSLEFVNDSTNFDADICNRNKIRHKAIPVLKEVNEGFEQNFLRLRSDLLEADSFMKAEALKLLESAKVQYGYDAKVINASPLALKKYALKLLFEEAGAGFEHKHIELIASILGSDGAVPLTGGFVAVVKQGVLRVITETEKEDVNFSFDINSELAYGGKIYSFKEVSQEEIVHKKLSHLCIGCDKMGLSAYFRTRKQGDRFSLLKRGITKDFRKLQNELKIPSEQRDSLLILISDENILWAEGVGVSSFGKYEGGNGILIKIREDKGYA